MQQNILWIFYNLFSTCYPAKTEVSYDTTEEGLDWKKILHCTSWWTPAWTVSWTAL